MKVILNKLTMLTIHAERSKKSCKGKTSMYKFICATYLSVHCCATVVAITRFFIK